MDIHLKQLPLFPLGILLLPGEKQALHIFEPRYRQLVAEMENGKGFFGIPYFSGERNSDDRLFGSLVRITQVLKRYPGGESDIVIECIDLFQLDNFQVKSEDKLYPSGDVELLVRFREWPISVKLREQFGILLTEMNKDRSLSWSANHVFQIMRQLDLNPEDKLKFLNGPDLKITERRLMGMMRLSSLILMQEKKKEFDFYMN